ncbi:MAG TPA: T9SS type A sorting domain-containing protein [Saprospiraceae bacterium]|nr:T9SS type A sorting domain-containing protein [Saprospiraceae bacterium]HMU03387.1 T9SS type A sorting domain-containing protein [Saprospiraceae bacterium]
MSLSKVYIPYVFALILSSVTSNFYAQEKGDYIWFCGYESIQGSANFSGHTYDFNNKEKLVHNQELTYGFARCNASISDKFGNLLIYTNGRGVFNKNHELILNGDNLNNGEWTERFWPNPKEGYPGPQDILILNNPNNENQFYILHKTRVYYPIGYDSTEIRISLVDLTKNNGLGEVLFKNEYFYLTQNLLVSYLSAIRHENQRDWWILQPTNSTKIKTFLIDASGINVMQDQDAYHRFTAEKSSSSGTARFSPDGRQYAIYNETDNLLIYDFDRATGTLTFKKKMVPIDTSGIGIFCSVEWSPNSRFIYTATSYYLHQIDTWEEDDSKAIQLIDTYDGTLDPFRTSFFLMVLGPDCKIYMTPVDGSYSIHVINHPNELGKACDFVQNGIKLPNANAGGLPNFPRLRVDEEEKCDPTISSIFGETVYYRKDLQVYPNPTSADITVEIPEQLGTANLVVTDINGKIWMQREIQHTTIEAMDLSSMPSGHYNVEIYPVVNKERIFYSKQVVKI